MNLIKILLDEINKKTFNQKSFNKLGRMENIKKLKLKFN